MGLLRHPLRVAYGQLGPRYPKLALVLILSASHVVVLGGIGLLRVYQPMSAGQFWTLVGVAQLLVLFDNVLGARCALRLLQPADQWLRGDRSEATTTQAWRAVSGLPLDAGRERGVAWLLFDLVPVCVFATWYLHLPAASVLLILLGSGVVLLYGVTLRFFTLELAMRPLLHDIAVALPDGAGRGMQTVSLRVKLLAGLPAINIISGVIVAGLSTSGQATLRDLGVNVVVAVMVAATVSFELTLLLSRSILEPVNDLRRATERVSRGDLGARVLVTASDETGELADAFNLMVAGLQERKALHEALGSYVDPDLAERILTEGTLLEGEEVEVTILFVDIRDFTAFAERSSAREVVDELNAFYDLVVPILLEHGGHANKFVGDGLLGVFGAPDRRPDHADRGLAAACAIAAAVREHYVVAPEPLRIGIGVNSGPVVAGTIGGGGHLEFTVIGDPVNTASRVEALTRETGDEILITEATRCLLDRWDGRLVERPPAELKGKAEPVRLWSPEGDHRRDGQGVTSPARITASKASGSPTSPST